MYESFLKTPARKHWERIGLCRRAGAAAALFSLFSSRSIGVGDLSDVKLLIDWCAASGLSLLQLLPMNDVGLAFQPYDAQSFFALEPVYLDVERVAGVDTRLFSSQMALLRNHFPVGGRRVNFKIKEAKLELLWEMFRSSRIHQMPPPDFSDYQRKTEFWLEDYVLFKILKERYEEAGWELWPREFREREPQALERFWIEHSERALFYRWLQWQLFLQFRELKRYAEEKGVLLIGDLPFLVSRDSADVWSHQRYFKLNLSSGAPPDAYFAHGQRWGMPPYDWNQFQGGTYDVMLERLSYARNFYDAFRIDHAVGVFRIWTIPVSEPLENAGLNGSFDPSNEKKWERRGKEFLSLLIQNTDMIPCAEDLGTVPECSYRVLKTLGIPGMDVQRWTKEERSGYAFKTPRAYRENSVAVLSTHDTASFRDWWLREAGTVDEALFQRLCTENGILFERIKAELFDPKRSFHGRLRWRPEVNTLAQFKKILGRRDGAIKYLCYLYESSYDEKKKFLDFLGLPNENENACSYLIRKRALEKASEARSIWSIQWLEDWLGLSDLFQASGPYEFRVNRPGTADERNWSVTMPLSLEKMNELPIHKEIHEMNRKAGRI